MVPRSLRILYLVLAGVGLTAALATLLYPDADFIQEFGANIATESAAIIVTLAFVRTILDRQERARRMRASIGAIRKARVALGLSVSTWGELVKGCLPAVPAERPTTAGELLASHYTEHLARFDPAAERRPRADGEEGDGATKWTDWATTRLSKSRLALLEIARGYGAVLEPDYIEVLEALVDDPFQEQFVELIEEGADARSWRFQMNLSRGTREAYFRALVLAMEVQNRIAGEAAEYRSRSLLPRQGALDIDLPEHEDLMLDTRLSAGFWKTQPVPASLRAEVVGERGGPPGGGGGVSRQRGIF